MLQRLKKILFILLTCLLLVSCQESEIASRVSNKESYKIINALYGAGITAKREQISSSSDAGYRILVNEKDFFRSLKILEENNLPTNERELTLANNNSNIFTALDPSLIKAKLEENTANQIENFLQEMEGVISVKALVKLFYTEPLGSFSNKTPSTEEAMLKESTPNTLQLIVKLNKDNQDLKTDIEKAVLKIVPKLKPENFEITYKIAQDSSIPTKDSINTRTVYPFLLEVPENQFIKHQLQVVAGFLLTGSLGFLLAYLIFRKRTKNNY